jgi:hypothetical protein
VDSRIKEALALSKLYEHGKGKSALWHKLCVARESLTQELATARGWRVGKRSFTLAGLKSGATPQSRESSDLWFVAAAEWCTAAIDHADFLRTKDRPYRAVAVLSHSYLTPKSIQYWADCKGLAVEFLPKSWWNSGTTAAIFTAQQETR